MRKNKWESISGQTPVDVSGLRLKGVSNRKDLDVAEAKNVRKAVVKYLAVMPSDKLAPFELTWLKRLHKEMFGEVWQWAGEYRTVNLNVGCEWAQIQVQLMNMLADLQQWKLEEIPLIEQAARLHHRAVWIHPFQNGNGRWSRLLANIWLKKHQHPLTIWPEEQVGGESIVRKEYLEAIREADNGNVDRLIELHRRFT